LCEIGIQIQEFSEYQH